MLNATTAIAMPAAVLSAPGTRGRSLMSSITAGVAWAVYVLPLSGLFMSVIYPTLNSKGISCLPKSEHGSGAGVILFFTCASAVIAPLAIGAVGDRFGDIVYGFWLATAFAAVLFAGSMLNWLVNPTRHVLEQRDALEYGTESRPYLTSRT